MSDADGPNGSDQGGGVVDTTVLPDSVAAEIKALVSSTQSFLHTLADFSDDQAREPSLLPGWSRGHVLTHVARNAEAIVNLVTWAQTGEVTRMYPSRDKRNADIEAGSGRPAADLVEDVRATHVRMLAEMTSAPPHTWTGQVEWGAANRRLPGAMIPYLRRVEVEVHHVDLDLDYTLAHLPEDFVEQMLAETVKEYSAEHDMPGLTLVGNDGEGRWTIEPGGPQVSGPPPSLLGWLLGRTDGVGLHSDDPLPKMGEWR